MTDTDRRWTQEERLASLKHRLASETARRAPDLTDLTDLALARYAVQWAGTARGCAALAEIARREDETELDARDADDAGQGWGRQALVEDDDAESADVYGGTIPSIVRVRETIRHGDYRHTGESTAPTVREALHAVLTMSGYSRVLVGIHEAQLAAALDATGRAEYGWADYSIVA